uniref:Globoside alpha-1,3-N-acetylgalactosaminyltransferase 1-like protein n=1 Tax=Callorhinchus milii TaxID=7868 RepID=A0A4W3JPH5_CALMI
FIENDQFNYLPQPQREESTFLPNATYWGAPIIWEKTFQPSLNREQLKTTAFSIGLTVFAIGTYKQYLYNFVQSAEKYFMTGYFVTYYILTDNLDVLPSVKLGTGREIKPFYIAEKPGWIHLWKARTSLLSSVIKELIQNEVQYVFCMDVDQIFMNNVGSEILGDLVATLHPDFYDAPKNVYPYEQTSVSKAYVDGLEGDYYYTSELYGGKCNDVYELTLTCSQFIIQDIEIDFTAIMFEESYLNRYFINTKPTKVLSSEYSWPARRESTEFVVKRIFSLERYMPKK